MKLDQLHSSDVLIPMSSLSSRFITVSVLVAVLGCSNKTKTETSTPSTSGTGAASNDTQFMNGAGEVGAQSGEGSAQPTTPDSGAASSDNEGGPVNHAQPSTKVSESASPAVAPPDLDITDQAQAERVNQHIRAAKAALSGTKKEPDQAISEARAALAVDPTNIDAVALLAHAYYAKRLYDTAEVMLDMAFKERRKAVSSPNIYYVYGLIYSATERHERAILAYEKAVELDPNYVSALVNLGLYHLRNKRFADAVRIYERLTGPLGAASAVTWNNLGTAYRGHSADYAADSDRRNELLRQAEAAYKKALSVDRDYANTYYNLGLLYLDAESFPGPDGTALDTLKRLERAKTYFDQYATMSGANIELVGERNKEVKKLIKREAKQRNNTSKGSEDKF